MAGEPEGMVSWLCGLCADCCCCCESRVSREKRPLLGINGKPLPKDHEVQEMDFSMPSEPSSPGGSTPWGSEKQSVASEPPGLADLEEPVQKQPLTSQSMAEPSCGENGRMSWKLVSSVPQEQQQFIIKIRKQTE